MKGLPQRAQRDTEWRLQGVHLREVLEWLQSRCPICVGPQNCKVEYADVRALRELFAERGELTIGSIQRRLNIGQPRARTFFEWVREASELERFNGKREEPRRAPSDTELVHGHVVPISISTMVEDPNSDISTRQFRPFPRALLIEFASEEDVCRAMDAGMCRFSVFGGDEKEGRKL